MAIDKGTRDPALSPPTRVPRAWGDPGDRIGRGTTRYKSVQQPVEGACTAVCPGGSRPSTCAFALSVSLYVSLSLHNSHGSVTQFTRR
jgi:hypothetical protein